MDERPEPPAEGKLIAGALARSRMSIRQASRRAGISYGRWRQITTGYQNVSAGSFARVRAPASTLARMADVVGVIPEALEESGRPDAAEALREILTQARPSPDPDAGPLTVDEQRLVSAFVKAIRSGAASGEAGAANGT